MSTRDFQRQRVYNSEEYAKDSLGGNFGKYMSTVNEMQAWVDEIVRSRWFRARWPFLTYIEVKDGRGRRRATGYARGLTYRNLMTGRHESISTEGVLKMPRWSRYELIMLHEMTHVIIDHVYKRKVPGHGVQFCNLYLSMVRRFMGKEWQRALKDAFKHYKVKHRMVNV
jgi:putative metallohydrolase (TIGR04338 family)